MRRASLLALAAIFALSACDGQVTGPDSRVAPEGPLLSTDSDEGYLVDTGPHDSPTFQFFTTLQAASDGGTFQFVAGRFDLDEPAQVDAIELFAWVFDPGGVNVVFRANEDGYPGEAMASRTYAVDPNGGSGWVVLEEYDAALPAGTYWLSFEPVPDGGFRAALPSGAEWPLEEYAFRDDNGDGWGLMGSAPEHGMRVSGTVLDGDPEQDGAIDAPEELVELSVTVASLDVNPGVRNSLEALVRNALRKFEAGELEPGCGMLRALMAQLEAQSGRQVPEETAQDLIGQIELIRSQVGC